jgi:hypothetical protein
MSYDNFNSFSFLQFTIIFGAHWVTTVPVYFRSTQHGRTFLVRFLNRNAVNTNKTLVVETVLCMGRTVWTIRARVPVPMREKGMLLPTNEKFRGG